MFFFLNINYCLHCSIWRWFNYHICCVVFNERRTTGLGVSCTINIANSYSRKPNQKGVLESVAWNLCKLLLLIISVLKLTIRVSSLACFFFMMTNYMKGSSVGIT